MEKYKVVNCAVAAYNDKYISRNHEYLHFNTQEITK